jgi:hypothetical protein
MKGMPAAALAAAVSAVLVACGSSSTPANTTAGGSAAPGQSCHAQFEGWKHGPARTAGKAFVAQFKAVRDAGNGQDIPRTVAALKAAGRGAAALEAYPMPKCADPHGYWKQLLTRIRSAADNASTGNGLGALLLAIGPLRAVPGILQNLSAELKQNAGVTGAFS